MRMSSKKLRQNKLRVPTFARKLNLGEPNLENNTFLCKHREFTDQNIVFWCMAELPVGIRCYWNGSIMYSQNGAQYNLPSSYTSALPQNPLDLVLCDPTGGLLDTSCLSYKAIRMVVLDAPALEMPFEERLILLSKESTKFPSFLKVAQYRQCTSKAEALEYLDLLNKHRQIQGIILKIPKTLYKGALENTFVIRSRYVAEGLILSVLTSKKLLVIDRHQRVFCVNVLKDTAEMPHPFQKILFRFNATYRRSQKPVRPIFIRTLTDQWWFDSITSSLTYQDLLSSYASECRKAL